MENNKDAQLIEKGLDVLESLLKEREQTQIREQLSKLVETMGYTACAREILNNRKAKENAKYILNMYYNKNTGDRVNPETREVFKIPKETIDKMNEFKEKFMLMVDKLENNTEKQLQYLDLKIQYGNVMYKLAELYKEHTELFESLRERNEESINKVNEHTKLIDEQNEIKQDIEDQMDKLVLEGLK
jgi:hypothetical protein